MVTMNGKRAIFLLYEEEEDDDEDDPAEIACVGAEL